VYAKTAQAKGAGGLARRSPPVQNLGGGGGVTQQRNLPTVGGFFGGKLTERPKAFVVVLCPFSSGAKGTPRRTKRQSCRFSRWSEPGKRTLEGPVRISIIAEESCSESKKRWEGCGGAPARLNSETVYPGKKKHVGRSQRVFCVKGEKREGGAGGRKTGGGGRFNCLPGLGSVANPPGIDVPWGCLCRGRDCRCNSGRRGCQHGKRRDIRHKGQSPRNPHGKRE